MRKGGADLFSNGKGLCHQGKEKKSLTTGRSGRQEGGPLSLTKKVISTVADDVADRDV